MSKRGFIKKFRLKTKDDECGDEIILTKLGHFFFDGRDLCWYVEGVEHEYYMRIKRSLGKHCRKVLDCEDEGIFYGIPPKYWEKVVKDSKGREQYYN